MEDQKATFSARLEDLRGAVERMAQRRAAQRGVRIMEAKKPYLEVESKQQELDAAQRNVAEAEEQIKVARVRCCCLRRCG